MRRGRDEKRSGGDLGRRTRKATSKGRFHKEIEKNKVIVEER